jgi:hypothetical protein
LAAQVIKKTLIYMNVYLYLLNKQSKILATITM